LEALRDEIVPLFSADGTTSLTTSLLSSNSLLLSFAGGGEGTGVVDPLVVLSVWVGVLVFVFCSLFGSVFASAEIVAASGGGLVVETFGRFNKTSEAAPDMSDDLSVVLRARFLTFGERGSAPLCDCSMKLPGTAEFRLFLRRAKRRAKR
jgi:hypothetical protein